MADAAVSHLLSVICYLLSVICYLLFVICSSVAHRHLAVDAVVERDKGLGPGHSLDILNLVVKQLHQVLVVAGIELDKHRVRAGGEMALHYFGDFFKLGNNVAVQRAAFKVDADIGAGAETEYFRVYRVSRPRDDVKVNHALDALMDGRA